MALSLDALPTEVLQYIGRHLPQRDFIALSALNKNVHDNVYPRHVTFNGDDVRSFLSWVRGKDVESMDITLADVREWNATAPHFLEGKTFEKITIHPRDIEHMKIKTTAYHKIFRVPPLYIPDCNEVESGFCRPSVISHVSKGRLFIRSYRIRDMEIPYMRLPETIHEICVEHYPFIHYLPHDRSAAELKIRGVKRVPTSLSILISGNLPEEDFPHIAKFQKSVDLNRVNIVDEAFVFEATELKIDLKAMRMVASAPRCVCLIIVLDEDTANLQSISRESFPQLQSVTYQGNVRDEHELDQISNHVFGDIPHKNNTRIVF